MNNMRQSTKPLVGNSVASSTDPLGNGPKMTAAKKSTTPAPTAFGTDLTTPKSPAPVSIPGVNPTLSAAIQASQNQANNANNTRYGQGLSVLSGGQNAQQSDIASAMQDVANYGQAAQTRLGQQLQTAQGQATQSATSRGLGDTTIANTMQDQPIRQYNDAMNAVTEQQSAMKSGLETQAGQAAQQGSNSIAGFINGRTDQGPNTGEYAQLAQNAANHPGSIAGAAGAIQMAGAAGNPASQSSATPPKSNSSPAKQNSPGYFGPGWGSNNMAGSSSSGSDSSFSGGGSGGADFGGGGSIEGSMSGGGGGSYYEDDPGFG